jgi:hypothetical protein
VAAVPSGLSLTPLIIIIIIIMITIIIIKHYSNILTGKESGGAVYFGPTTDASWHLY